MNIQKLKEKLLIHITAGEFLYLQQNYSPNQLKEKLVPESGKKYVYGILGLANLFNCSKSSAHRIKKSGVIDRAIIQNGRKIIVDSELALELIKESK
ncbi:DUF3853 family protein [Formosa algae]|uniref:DUF3853 domain-containing protein n=2 Tax=Formosa algae TaxID=225843 RepID=A0A9X0YHP2_9FLAO|nr:DUF3853 family protein [Formosa algae]MBP1838777.1 hypothetical protein [Formosa algae]MDQ0335277.1 hypothetical protein [Formosa algae]